LDVELVDYIRELKKNYCTVLLSNAFSNLRAALEERWQIDDAFHHIVISAEAGLMKPDPAIYRLALEKTGFEPEEAVFIDDFERNVEGARDVGLHAIHFQDAAQAREQLETLLHKVEA
jgi:epoxide hydrolase-like predicted phosphatase